MYISDKKIEYLPTYRSYRYQNGAARLFVVQIVASAQAGAGFRKQKCELQNFSRPAVVETRFNIKIIMNHLSEQSINRTKAVHQQPA